MGTGDDEDQRAVIARMAATIEAMNSAIVALSAAQAGSGRRPAPDLLVSELGARYARRASKKAMYTLVAFLAHFRDRAVSSLRKADYLHWRDEIRAVGDTRKKRPRAVGTLNQELAQVLAMFRWAVTNEIIDVNPFEGVRRLKGQRPRETEIDALEHADAFTSAPLLVRVFQAVCIETGMRNGCEVRRMERGHINRARSTIHVPRENVKGKTRARDVPMSDYLRKMLDELPPVVGSPFVFANPHTKKPYSAKHLAALSRPYLDKLPHAPGDYQANTHDTRHGAVSRLARGGLNPMAAMKIIGHSSPSMHWRYLHVSEADKAKAKSLLDAERKPAHSASRVSTDDGNVVSKR